MRSRGTAPFAPAASRFRCGGVHRAIGMGGDRLVAALCGDVVEEKMGDVLRERWSESYDQIRRDVQPLPGAIRSSGEAARGGSSTRRGLLGQPGGHRGRAGHRGCPWSAGGDRERRRRGELQAGPRCRRTCWQRLGEGPAKVVGDTVYDVAAAQAIGLPCITVRTGGVGEDELRPPGPLWSSTT